MAFVKNPYGLPCINHINGDKAKNMSSNLEWVTHKQNTHHARDMGLLHPKSGDEHHSRLRPEGLARGERNGSRKYPERLKRGEENPRSKLREDDIVSIRGDALRGFSHLHLSKMFGVSRQLIYLIRARKQWRHVK